MAMAYGSGGCEAGGGRGSEQGEVCADHRHAILFALVRCAMFVAFNRLFSSAGRGTSKYMWAHEGERPHTGCKVPQAGRDCTRR